MEYFLKSFEKLFLLLQVFGFQVIYSREVCSVKAQDRSDCGLPGMSKDECNMTGCCWDDSIKNAHFCFFPKNLLTYQCNSTSFSLVYGSKNSDGTTCRACLSSEANRPICQRRLYTPVAPCDQRSVTISFELKSWTTIIFQDSLQASQPENFGNKKTPMTLKFQPWNRAFVMDLKQATFVPYISFVLRWNSSLSSLQFTVDYSLDGFHWTDYVEDERVKIFRTHKGDPGQCLCRKLFTRFLRMTLINESDIGSTFEGSFEATYCSVFQMFSISAHASLNHTRLYLGCYQVSAANSGIFYSGLAGYTEIDETVCIKRCSDLGYRYATIQSGQLCFCGDDVPSETHNHTECLLPYFSRRTNGQVFMRYYRIPKQNLTINNVKFSHKQRRLGEIFTIDATVNSDQVGLVKFTINFGDGNELSFCDSPGSYFYKNPGHYKVKMTIEDLKGNQFSFNETMEIYDNLTEVVVQCPKATPDGRMARCKAKVARGLSVMATVTEENKTLTSPQEIPGSRMSRVGEDFPHHLLSTSTMPETLLGKSERTYVLTANKFQEEGYLAVLEFIVLQPGPIRIQILREIDVEKATQDDTSQNLIQCTDFKILFLDLCACYSSSSSSAQVNSDQGLPNGNYTIVSDIMLGQHMSSGHHCMDLSNVTKIKVLPGDMLAWLSSNKTGKIAMLSNTSKTVGQIFEGMVDGGVSDGLGLQHSPSGMTFALSSYFVPISSSDVTFSLEKIGVHQVLLTLKDKFGNEQVRIQEIAYQKEITDLTLNLPEFAFVGEVTLGLSITNGTNVTYIWHFGDNQTAEIFNETTVIHNYTSSGPHNVSVIAYNDVTVAQSECNRPYILFPVKELNILPLDPVMVNENFAIVISLGQGSLVDLSVSLGDESIKFNLTGINVKNNFLVAINHSYYTAGVFTVLASAENILSNASAFFSIIVQWPVIGFNVSFPNEVHSSHEDLAFNMSFTHGTNVTYNITSTIDWEFGTAAENFTTVVIPKNNLTAGLLTLVATAFNLVSSKEISGTIAIETPITGAKFWLESSFPGAVEARKPPTFTFYYQTGSNVSIAFQKDLGLNTWPVPPGRETANSSKTFNALMYQYPGVFMAQVNYSNALGSVSLKTKVIVQEPVKDIEILSESSVPFPPGVVDIIVRQNGILATNATVTCSYGDGSASPKLDFTNDFNFSHRYSRAGEYKVVVNISNLVTFESREVNVEIEAIPTVVLINAKSSADASSSASVSLLSGNSCPLEFSILFDVKHNGDPTKEIDSFFDFGDGTRDVSGEHTYTSPGEFLVTVTLEHQFGNLTNTSRIIIQESLSGLAILDDAPTVVNTPTTFTLTWDKLGTDTLIEVAFGNGEVALFGENISTADSSLLIYPLSSSQKNISFLHTYNEIRLYDVMVTGWNDVSSVSFSHRTVDVEKECRYPYPIILGAGQLPRRALNVIKQKEVIIYARIVVECKASYETAFEWKAYHRSCDDTDNASTPIAINTELNQASLTIPAYSLPTGIVCLIFQAKMKYFVDAIDSYTYGFLNVLQGKLKARIVGGNFRTVSSQRNIEVDGSVSQDLDTKGGNLSGVQFTWFCRRKGERFSIGVQHLPPVSFENVSSNSYNYGCEGSGPRMLVYAAPVWEVRPGVLKENETYVVRMVITKDNRQASFEQTIKVVREVPPEVVIGCIKNCDEKVNTQSQLSVSCSCRNCDREGFTNFSYQWELYVERNITGEWSAVSDLSNKAMTNIYLENIVLRQNALINDRNYRLTCSVKNEDGAEGRSDHNFLTNTPPMNGNCSVSPTVGEMLKTFFYIECQDWQDEDGNVRFKVYHRDELILHGNELALSPMLLPMGDPLYNYTYKLTVRIADKYHSFSEAEVTVTVTESTMSTEEMTDLLESKDGLLTNMLISGNTQGIAQLVGSVSTKLDILAAQETFDKGSGNLNGDSDSNSGDSDNRKNGGETLEDSEAKKSRMKMREDMLGALNAVKLESLETAGVLLEAMAVASDNVEELSTASQLSMLNVLSNAVSTLSAKENGDSSDLVESVGTGVLENLGNLFGASKYQKERNAKRAMLLQEKTQNNDQSQATTQTSGNARNKTKAAMKVLNDVLDTLSDYLMTGQEPQLIESERLSALVMKMHIEHLSGSSITIVGGSFVLSNMEEILGSWDDEDCYIVAKGLNSKDNPFIWDNSSSEVESNCLGLQFIDCHGNPIRVANLTEPIYITIPRQGAAGELPQPDNFTIEKRKMKTHKITVQDNSDSIHVIVHPLAVNCSHKFRMFLREDKRPTTEQFDFNWTMEVVPGVVDWKEGFSLSVSNLKLRSLLKRSGTYYLGLYVDDEDIPEENEECDELRYTLFSFASSCNFWDEDDEKWKGHGCEVGSETSLDSTVCRCTHLTNFGGGFLVAPNPIDFDKVFESFSDLASNPVVFATVLIIFGLYFVGVIWARWRDIKDLEKIGVTPLLSNDPRDAYSYEITLQTGFKQRRRTTADVFIQLIGSLGDSEPRMLKDPKRPKFGRGEIDQFLLTVPQSLGAIKEIHVWHNNAGKYPAWYLFRVLIRDLQMDSKWWFVCDRWLAVEEDDGAVDRRLHLASKEDLTKFNILFANATRKNLLDGHLWLSVFTRPPKSTFTRVQRLSCCLSLILTTMLANLMFYQVGADDSSSGSQSINIGPFVFSVQQIMIGIQSSFVVLPVNILIITIFRKLKQKDIKSKPKRYEEIEETTPPSSSSNIAGEESQGVGKVYAEGSKKNGSFSWRNIVSIFKRDDESEDKARKRFLFPHWCIHIAYLLVILSSLISGTFCIFYGLMFEKEKSMKWLTSMLVSFFQSILVIQPFKVLVLAAFFALIIKDPNKEEEQERENAPDTSLKVDEESLTADKEKDNEQRLSFDNKPPTAKKLEAARKLRLKQCEMKAIIKEIITHFLVVCVVLIVAYGNHDERAFSMNNEVKNVLVDGGLNNFPFDMLSTKNWFWNWAINSLIPGLFPSNIWEEYPYIGIMENGQASSVLGTGRIRQIRIKKDTCHVPEAFSMYIQECNDFYSWSEEERNDFSEGWYHQSNVNQTESEVAAKEHFTSPWHYQSVMEASSFPYVGKMASYRGGGFIVELGPDDVTALDQLINLEANGWVDRYTRALFTELSIYNVYINLLCVVTLLYEELPTGGGSSFVSIQAIRVYRYIGNFSAALMACEIICAFLLLRWILQDGKKLWKERKAFWKNVWNIVDISVTTLCLTSVVLYFTRLVFLNSAINEVHKNRSKFVSFQYVVLLNEGVNIAFALIVLLLNLKFLRMLRFNRKISVLSVTMKASASKLASFMVLFLVIFLAYCFLVFLVFGPVLEDYRTIIRCMVSMMSMVLGNFAFYDLVDVNRFIGPAVFFTFMITFQFIIINVFIGILCECFSDVRADAVKQSNDYEILQFMSNRIKAFMGLFVEPPIRPEYSWPKSELEKKVQSIEEKAETTMFFMRNLCAEDVRQIRWFERDSWSAKKSMVMSLVLNADVDVMESDLCDGVEAMNKIVENYSENELCRMLVASRLRSQSSQIGASCSEMSDNEESGDSETEDQDSDEDVVEANLDTRNECADEIKCEDPESVKEEVDEELMEEIEEEFENNEQEEEEHDQETEECSKVDSWEGEIQPESFMTSLCTNENNCTASSKAVTFSPLIPESRNMGSIETLGSELGDTMKDNFQEQANDGFIKTLTTAPSNLLSVQPAGIPTQHFIHVGTVNDCITIFVKEADDDGSFLQCDSEA